MKFFIFGEDFVTVLIGPFPDRATAEGHLAKYSPGSYREMISFPRPQLLQHSYSEIISEAVARHIRPDDTWTPEQDIELKAKGEAQL